MSICLEKKLKLFDKEYNDYNNDCMKIIQIKNIIKDNRSIRVVIPTRPIVDNKGRGRGRCQIPQPCEDYLSECILVIPNNPFYKIYEYKKNPRYGTNVGFPFCMTADRDNAINEEYKSPGRIIHIINKQIENNEFIIKEMAVCIVKRYIVSLTIFLSKLPNIVIKYISSYANKNITMDYTKIPFVLQECKKRRIDIDNDSKTQLIKLFSRYLETTI